MGELRWSSQQIDLSPPLHLRTSVNPGRKLWGGEQRTSLTLSSVLERGKAKSLSLPREGFNTNVFLYLFFFHEVSDVFRT